MTFCVEYITDKGFDFDETELANRVCTAVLAAENCPLDTQVNIYITDNAGIRDINKAERGIDKETDVLSFPNLHYDTPAEFDMERNASADCTDPETGEVILGDIVISIDRVSSQAKEYGHSIEREYAFLIAHSMYHLCGYDHTDDESARLMEERQESVLTGLGIVRE